ncbi:MAG: MFS transporter [Anaerolineaceae bacterium]
METPENPKKPLLSPVLKTFMATMILANIAGGMWGSFLPLYLKSLGANVTQIGLFFTISQIIPLILQILGGWISDNLGRLRSVAFGSLFGVLQYIGLILAPTWIWVLIGQGLGAITHALVGPSFSAFIAEESSAENRGQVYGTTEAIFTIVSIVGPPFGGYLTDHYGFKLMLIVSGIIYTIATVLRIIMAKHATPQKTADKKVKLDLGSLKVNLGAMVGLIIAGGVMTWIMVTDGIRDISFSLWGNLLPVYLEDLGGMNAQKIGWLFSIMSVATMLINIPAGKMADRKGEKPAIMIGFVAQATAVFLFVSASNFYLFALAFVFFGIGSGLMGPAYQSLLSKVLPERLRGTGFGLIQSSLGVFSLPAPAIGAAMYNNVSPKSPFLVTAWVSLLALIPAFLKFKVDDKDQQAIAKAEEKLDQYQDTQTRAEQEETPTK